MDTIKYFSKLIIKIFLLIIFLLFISLIAFVILSYRYLDSYTNDSLDPEVLYQELISADKIEIDAVKTKLDNNQIWLMILNNDGEVIDEHNLPASLNRKYSLNDVVKFTRWYLNGYPVFTFVYDDKTIVFGYPVNYYDKFPSNYYNFNLYKNMFLLGLGILAFFFTSLLLIFLKTKNDLLKEIKPIKESLISLSLNKKIQLNEKGNLSEIKQTLNETSVILQKSKEMRSHWIRGVSHDLRNPLTLVIGYTNQLENKYGINKETTEIKNNIANMQDILTNLNLSYLLDDQSFNKNMVSLDLNKLSKEIIAEFINTHEDIQMEYDLPKTHLIISANQVLIERGLRNLLNNCLIHNDKPIITYRLEANTHEAIITIKDNGNISKEKVEELKNKTINYDSHGMGTIITKQIVNLHQGKIDYKYTDPGLEVKLTFRLEK